MKMLALIGQKDKAIAVEKNAKTTMGDIPGNRPLPGTREEKVRSLRQQLTKGTYDIEKRLNAASDKLLEVLVIRGNTVRVRK